MKKILMIVCLCFRSLAVLAGAGAWDAGDFSENGASSKLSLEGPDGMSAEYVYMGNVSASELETRLCEKMQKMAFYGKIEYAGCCMAYKWNAHKYVIRSGGMVSARLAVVVEAQGGGGLVVELGRHMDGEGMTYAWEVMLAAFMENYNSWTDMFAERCGGVI